MTFLPSVPVISYCFVLHGLVLVRIALWLLLYGLIIIGGLRLRFVFVEF